ncbi:MAG: DMT family protein [Phenylobacterium sp.]
MPTLLLLTLSNIFMTAAWYWHLKGGMNRPLMAVILISWGIAFFEYCLAVPANRLGYAGGWSAGQLKVAQEIIALTVFGVFMVTVMGEAMTWRHLGAFVCIAGAAGFLFLGR